MKKKIQAKRGRCFRIGLEAWGGGRVKEATAAKNSLEKKSKQKEG